MLPHGNNQLIGNNTSTSQTNYLKLYKAIFQGNRSGVISILQHNNTSLVIAAAINERSETPLHVAISVRKANSLVPLLLKMVPPNADMASAPWLDQDDNTVLMVAALVGNIRAAAMLRASLGYHMFKRLLCQSNAEGSTPLLKAAEYGNKRMLRFLLCFLEEQRENMSNESRIRFVKLLFIAGFYDLAFYVIERKMLEVSSFTDLSNCYESFLEIVAGRPASYSFWNKWDYMIYVQVIKLLCNNISQSRNYLKFRNPLLLAAKLGVQEVVEEILNSYPDAIWFKDDEQHNIFHLCVIHRHENIFGLLCEICGYKNLPIGIKDSLDKNILHLVAEMTPSEKLSSFCGPTLRMQYELKWYKEVEKHIPPSYSTESINNKTPSMIFTKTHESLAKAGEKWIKGAAAAGSVAATLIATVVFAAAINVPGGSKDGEGSPNLRKKNLFHIFLYADGLSLFLSLSSVLMFMSILASGYSESDFLEALTNRLIYGLLTLLFSLTSMVVAFWAAFIIATWGPLTSATAYTLLQLTYIPGFLFVFLLYPLLSQMIKLTWSSSIFYPSRSRLQFLHNYILPVLLCAEQLHMYATQWLCLLKITIVHAKEILLCIVDEVRY